MSRVAYIAALVFLALLLSLCVIEVCSAQPQPVKQRHNAYWPYSVETVIFDR